MGSLAAGTEEVGEQRAALVREDAGDDFDFVVEPRVVHYAEDGAARAGFWIGRSVDEASDARVEDGAGAHGAGFERDVERAAFVLFVQQTIVFERATGLAECDDFGVGGGIVVAEDAVLATGDDLALVNDDGADGNFAGLLGGVGFFDGGVKAGEVFGRHHPECRIVPSISVALRRMVGDWAVATVAAKATVRARDRTRTDMGRSERFSVIATHEP